MKKILIYAIFALSTIALASCSDDVVDTQQFQGGVSLNVFGPCPVARGGELQFIGSGMDRITSVEIPGCAAITDIHHVSDKEIRIVVPQTAEVGFVTLNYADGKILTKTPITYSEPVSIDAISPSKVRPGDNIEISGDYLNLMREVCFSFVDGGDSINVFIENFIAHDRNTITVVVPDKAVTGLVTVSDAKAVPLRVSSKTELVVAAPAVSSVMEIRDAKPGMSITVRGTDFDLVERVIMPNGSNVEFENTDVSLSFMLPEDICDGSIYVSPVSGVKVEVATVTVVDPTNIVVTPDKDVRPGDHVTITGDNVDQIASVNVANVSEPIEVSVLSSEEVVFVFPEMGQTGEMTMNLRNGKTQKANITTAKPQANSFSPSTVAAGGEFTINGKNLDLVAKVIFVGDISVEVNSTSSTELTLRADVNAKSGPLTLIMGNGESVRTFPLTIKSPECCFITEVVTQNLIAGELMEAKVGNGDKLTDVLVNSMPCQYIVNGQRLFINIPSTAAGETSFKLISSNGEIEYWYKVVNSAHQEIDLLEEPFDLGSWSGFFRVYKESLADVPARAKLVFYLDSRAYTQIQINDANWSQIVILQGEQGIKRLEYELSGEVLQSILSTSDGWSDTALCIQGEGATILRATVEYNL